MAWATARRRAGRATLTVRGTRPLSPHPVGESTARCTRAGAPEGAGLPFVLCSLLSSVLAPHPLTAGHAGPTWQTCPATPRPVVEITRNKHEASRAGAREHAQRTAELIAAWDADIVNLVEVEDCAALAGLVSRLDGAAAASSRFTAYLTQGRDSFTGQDVALLTRCAGCSHNVTRHRACLWALCGDGRVRVGARALPCRVDPAQALATIEARESFPLPGSACGFEGEGSTSISKDYVAKWRGLRVGSATLDVALISLHLKAFPTDARSCAQREAQATLARRAVEDAAAEGAALRATAVLDPAPDGATSAVQPG